MSKRIIFPVFALILMAGCYQSNKFDIDVSGVSFKPTIYHWEDRVFADKREPIPDLIAGFRKDSPVMFSFYMELLHIPEDNDTLLAMAFADYANNVYMKESYAEMKKVFASTAEIEKGLVDGFKRVKYHFARVPVPKKIIFMHTAFGFNVLADPTALGISLELYLGTSNPVITKLPDRDFPEYIKARMQPKYIVGDALKTWTEMYIVPEYKPVSLLDHLIWQGKVMYVLDALMPNTPDHDKIRYTEEQYAWCEEFEKDIWKEMIDNKWLYSSDEKVRSQFFNEGPFTPSLPQNSPSRAGVWIGWQMVRNYMEMNSDVTLEGLLAEKDNRKILGYYKPD